MNLGDAAREPRRKIARALKLFREAQVELAEWSAANPVKARLVPHDNRRRIDIVVEAGTEPPLESVALIVGDAVHNLRSALDNLAWTLAHLSSPPENPKSIYFPVCEKPSAWTKATKDLASIPAPVLERIKTLQPFTFAKNEECFLWILHRLDIADKHRSYLSAQPHWVGSDVEGLVLDLDADTTVQVKAADARLSTMANEVIGWIELSKPYWNPGAIKASVRVDTFFVVTYEEGGPAFSVTDMARDFPEIVEAMVHLVCVGEVRPDQITEETHFVGPE